MGYEHDGKSIRDHQTDQYDGKPIVAKTGDLLRIKYKDDRGIEELMFEDIPFEDWINVESFQVICEDCG